MQRVLGTPPLRWPACADTSPATASGPTGCILPPPLAQSGTRQPLATAHFGVWCHGPIPRWSATSVAQATAHLRALHATACQFLQGLKCPDISRPWRGSVPSPALSCPRLHHQTLQHCSLAPLGVSRSRWLCPSQISGAGRSQSTNSGAFIASSTPATCRTLTTAPRTAWTRPAGVASCIKSLATVTFCVARGIQPDCAQMNIVMH